MSHGGDPDPARLRELHEALLADEDPTVSSRLAELLLSALRHRFASARTHDPHLVESDIDLCIARYLREPWRYQPERGPLLAYRCRPEPQCRGGGAGRHGRVRLAAGLTGACP